jgi:circadian clock protein KaiC
MSNRLKASPSCSKLITAEETEMPRYLILLRYVEMRSQLRRLISVVKMRDSDFDPSLREFRITGTGIEIADTFESAEAVLSGFPQLKSEELPADNAARRPRGQ